jgi:hypothetical protein
MKSVTKSKENGHTLAEVRAEFVRKGTSFHGWCVANGIDSQNARKAFSGCWTGPKATAVVARIIAGAGLVKK